MLQSAETSDHFNRRVMWSPCVQCDLPQNSGDRKLIRQTKLLFNYIPVDSANSKLTELIVLNKCRTCVSLCVCAACVPRRRTETPTITKIPHHRPNSHHENYDQKRLDSTTVSINLSFFSCVFLINTVPIEFIFDLPFAFYFRSLNRFI